MRTRPQSASCSNGPRAACSTSMTNSASAGHASLRARKPVMTYAIARDADLHPDRLEVRPDGSTFDLGGQPVRVRIPGRFNVANALCAIGIARSMDIQDSDAVAGLESLDRVAGRMEHVRGGGVDVIVDYAHTPDALENVLRTLRETASRRLIAVFGCGGDRDRGKRPQMGAVAARYADFTYVTSDNPRSEDPRRIIEEILPGVGSAPHAVQTDRRAAIEDAVAQAGAGDVVVIAGKGHETYQIVGSEVLPFDDLHDCPNGACSSRGGAPVMLTLERAVRATGARVLSADRFPAVLRFVTDTRAISAGDTFLALRGERFDGHDYVRDALDKGAGALVIDDPRAAIEGVPTLLVAQTKRAYMDLAQAAREQFFGQVIAITGSAGKTTTKSLLAQMLGAYYGTQNVLASPANENNEIGVSKLVLAANTDPRVLVVEMGARHEGDIADLVRIARPHIGVLTNIGEAHLEIFGSREGLARTKWGLFSLGAQAVLNAGDSESVLRAASLATPASWFGTGDPGPPGVYVRDARTLVLTYGSAVRELPIDLRVPGAHNRANLAAALAAALLLGIPPEDLTRAIPALTLPPGRYEAISVEGGTRLIFDAYNANTSGMIAALDAFADERADRHIAVLASMAELGSDAPAMHERVGAHAAASGVDILLVSGDYAGSVAAGAVAAGLSPDRVVTYGANADAVRWLREHARECDVVLLKGSRKYKMEEIVETLRGSKGEVL